MKLIRIEKSNFNFWSSQIEELINCSIKINFPYLPIKINYGSEKCDEIERYLKDGSAIIFAMIDRQKLIGWIWCHEIDRLGKKRLHIAEIAVREEFRHQGVGKKLLSIAESYAVEHDISETDLLVTYDNKTAVSFYEKSLYKTERCLMKKVLK